MKVFFIILLYNCAVVCNCPMDGEHSADNHILSHCRTTYREMVHTFDKISHSGKTPVFCCPLAIFYSKAKSKECM